jgi:outer membrane receptor protein involved in Fe transport
MNKALLLAMTALAGAPAWAQTATTAGQTAETSGRLEDIVVTARKTEETLQSAPVAVSVLSDKRIADLGLKSIDDFSKQATGISFSTAFGRASDRPVIRGQSNVLANVQFGVETGAAYFIDGIYYQGDIQGFNPDEIARVEIIKGPQSALYGRNTYAGAINFITKDPADHFSGSIRATAAEHDTYEVLASVSAPLLGDSLGFRAGGRYYRYGGEYTNQLTGKKVGQEKTYSGYAMLVGKLGDDLKIKLRGDYQHDRDGPLPIFLQGASFNNCKPGYRSPAYRTVSSALPYIPATLGASTNTNQYFCGVIRPQPNNVRLNTDPIAITIPGFAGPPPTFRTQPISGTFDGTAFDGIRNDTYLANAIIDWDIAGSGWTVSSLTGYRYYDHLFGTDSDHSESFFYFNTNPAIGGSPPNPLVTEPAFANTTRARYHDFSQELRLSTPTDNWIRAMVGVYYFKQRYTSVDLTYANPIRGENVGTDGSQAGTIEDKAVFGLVEVKPFEGFSVTGELRYAQEVKTLIDRTSSTSIFCAGEADRAAQFGFTGACQARAKFTGTDPRITINYKTPGGTLFYGVYATGRKPGGFNGTAGITAGLPRYTPEKAQSFEIGVKADVTPEFRVNGSLYRNKLTNIQLTSAIPDPNNPRALTSIVTNTGNGITQGFELELQASPAQGLIFGAGVSYVDAHFTKGCDADYFILNSGGIRVNFDTRNPPAAAVPLCSIKGKKLPLGSPWIINGSATYEHPLGSSAWTLFTNANFSYEDKKFVQTDNLAAVGDTFLLNARIGVRNERFSITAFVKNLTNEDSVPLATRWFDYRYGAGTRNLPAAASVTFNGQPAVIETGAPRAFFGTLRKGRTFGVEAAMNF